MTSISEQQCFTKSCPEHEVDPLDTVNRKGHGLKPQSTSTGGAKWSGFDESSGGYSCPLPDWRLLPYGPWATI